MNIRQFMQRYELTGGRDVGNGFREFTPPVTDLTERWEMEEDLKSMGIPFKNDYADNPGHTDFGKAILIFTLWDEAWKETIV